MAAYMIIFADIKNRGRFLEEYGKPTAAVIGKYGGEYVIRAPGVETLEGGFGAGVSAVISKWPSKDAIKTFWESDDYAPLKAARQPLADCHVMIVEEPT